MFGIGQIPLPQPKSCNKYNALAPNRALSAFVRQAAVLRWCYILEAETSKQAQPWRPARRSAGNMTGSEVRCRCVIGPMLPFSRRIADIAWCQRSMGTRLVKNYLIGGLILLVTALVVGIEPVQRVINEATKQGTLRGAEACMKYSRSELLSESAVRATCVRTFQKQLYHGDHATGRAGPRIGQRTVSWEGTLQNKTPDHVTTWIGLSIFIYDADGSEQKFDAEMPIWINPLDEAEFRLEIPDLKPSQIDNIEFCDPNQLEGKTCVRWGVTNVMGLSI
jgi:hypothetical protein